ncbi:MAG: response regulator [Melioribacteraceae bacterium]
MKEKLKILHLEDNSNDAELVKEMLLAGGIDAEIVVVSKKSDFLQLIVDKDFDMVISDYNLPEFDGLKALIETQKKRKDIPFIFCSGTIGEERAVQCLQLGAMDYVLKDRMDRLVPAVRRALRLVNEMKKREEAERLLRRVMLAVENTNDAIMMTDVDGTIIYVNPYFTEMYGWYRNEIVNKATPRILKSGLHHKEFYEQLWKNLLENKHVVVEMTNRTKDGKLIEIKNLISSIFDENHNLIGYVAIQTDISLRKQYERELIKAKKEAEEMSKLKSYFLSNISHEFRTPLISILGFSEILLNELDNPEHKESVKYIYESGLRLQKTLNDLLVLTEIEKEKLEVKQEKFNLVEFIKSISDEYRKNTEKKGLIFKLIIDTNEVWINTDRNLLKNTIDSIVDNSIKFTSKGGISINIRLEENDKNCFAIIRIVDTGIGIEKDKLEKIFMPFRQEKEGMSRPFEGMGLGLSIAKQMVERLNGFISVQSHVGKGTMVILKLPAIQSEKKLMKTIDYGKELVSETLITKKSTKPIVLVVEDNIGNRKIFQKYLSNDFDVEEAEDGITAIAKAEIKTYDAILMDINLGAGIDGIETFSRIRKLHGYNKIPIIAVTAFALKEDRQKFLDHGFTDYLQKPVVREELINLIQKYLRKESNN